MESPILPEYVGQWAFTVGGWLALEARHYYPILKRWIGATLETKAIEAEVKRDAVRPSDEASNGND